MCLKYDLDLQYIARNYRIVEYIQNKFNAVMMRLKKDSIYTCLMFSTGSLVLTVCKSVDECYYASLEIAAIVHELCYEVKLSGGSVKNMVGCPDCRFYINLYSLTENIGLNASFEPRLFPGLIFTTDKCKVTVFRSAKINITCSKCEEDLNKAFNSISYYLN